MKASTGGYQPASQLFSYITELREAPVASGHQVHGLLITGEPNAALETQVAALTTGAGVRVQWLCYRMTLEVETVFEADGRVEPGE